MRKTHHHGLAGYGYAMLGAVLFATKGIFIKFAYAEGIDTETLMALRMGISLPFFTGIALWIWLRRPAQRPAPRLLAGGALVGVLGYYVSSWLDFTGLAYISAQLDRLILFTYPFFTILFAALLFRQQPKASALAGAAVSYAGLVLVMTGGSNNGGHGDVVTGGLFVLAAAFTFGLYQVLAREFIVRMGSDFYTGLAMSAAATAAFIHFAASGHDLHSLAVSPSGLGISIGLALFGTVLPAFAIAAGLARIGAQGTAIIGTLSPLATTVLAVSLLGEPFGVVDALGTLLVVGGVGIYTLVDSRARMRALS